MTKLQRFTNILADVSVDLSTRKELIKLLIGDSINNNRTLSVRQVVRYLKIVGEYDTAHQISTVYELLKPILRSERKSYNYRTDAFDINELLVAAVFLEQTKKQDSLKRVISRSI